ncbi:unnamed protein product, partial [Staurois parvus]
MSCQSAPGCLTIKVLCKYKKLSGYLTLQHLVNTERSNMP